MAQTHAVDTERKSPVALRFLSLLRFCMIWLICLFYLFEYPGLTLTGKLFLGICAIALTIDDVYLKIIRESRMKFLIVVLDLVFISLFGILFPNLDGPFPLLFGAEGVTLFLVESQRQILKAEIAFLGIFAIGIFSYDFSIEPASGLWLILFNLSFIVFSLLVGWLIRYFRDTQIKLSDLYYQLEQSHEHLKNAHNQLQDYATQIEQLTMVREQNRIAHEIHDTVGHSMTALIVQLKVAQKFITKQPDSALHAIHNCEQVAREALEQIRGSVKAIGSARNEDIAFLTRIKNLTQNFAMMTCAEVELQIEGDVETIRTTIQPVILHVIQESLTNAVRHGEATKILVYLGFLQSGIRLSIKDNGRGTKSVKKGFGIINMERQIVCFGGTLKCESSVGLGFSLDIQLPMAFHTYGFERSEQTNDQANSNYFGG